MDVSMLDMALQALVIMSDPIRLLYLAGGVLIGLSLGVIPGLGGIVGMALLLPLVFTLQDDPYSAFALLLGMGSVVTTSDTIPAVLFGVPGTTGSAATILDGHPLAKQGQAGRAFGAAYSASLIGGVFGALLLGVSIPILRPFILLMGSPELLAFAVLGLSMVAVLSAGTPLRGLAVAGFGLMIAMVGQDPQTGTLRWTMDTLYLWDGLHLVPITLGLFALPELADMSIARRSIAGGSVIDSRSGQWEGIKDTFRNWWLVIRCAALGSTLGSIPGIGAAVIDWIAYGHAARTEKGAAETFGKGDIRGVIASESSNNAKEGGALVPTIAFGVPGSASMAILLGAFLILGLIPGPDMLSRNLDVTYSIVWSVALANILGAGLCFAFSNQFAKIALIRHSIIMPLILTVIFIGAFSGSRQWGDLFTVLIFGVLGWFMKRLGWPRPPLILGVVLGGIVERYLFISIQRYDFDWLFRPIVAVVFAIALLGLARPLIKEIRSACGVAAIFSRFGAPRFNISSVFYVGFIALLAVMVFQATGWKPNARIAPLSVGIFSLSIVILSFLFFTFRADGSTADQDAKGGANKTMRLDIHADDTGIEKAVVVRRALTYLGWLLGFLASVAVVGMLPTVLVFVTLYMRIEGKEKWRLTMLVSGGMTAFSYGVFERVLHLPWPHTLIGSWFPALKVWIPSM